MSDEKPGSDGLPHAWLEHRLDRLETRLAAHGTEMRDGFVLLRESMSAIAVHQAQIANMAADLKDVKGDLKQVTASANKIAGAGAVLAVITGLLSGLWKH